MGNVSSDFKEFEREAWESKASRYDTTWGLVSGQAIDAILDCAGPLEGKELLDCGCGPGHLCEAARARGAQVQGCDYSQQMVQIASENYGDITFFVEDAENMSIPDGRYDVVTMNFLLLHVAGQQETVLEGRRILRAGGTLIFSNWLPPGESPGLSLMFDAIREHADLSVIPPAQDIFTFSDSDYCRDFLIKNGFEEVEIVQVDSFWNVATPDDFFTAVQAGTRIGGTIDLQAAEVKSKIKEQIFSDIERFKKGGRYVIPTPSLVVAGRKS